MFKGVGSEAISVFQIIGLVAIFLASTWLVVLFTTAQRRIPIKHARRQIGTKQLGGASSYLPLSLNMTGVIPIIFAVSLISMPSQFAQMTQGMPAVRDAFQTMAEYLNPAGPFPKGFIACAIYTLLIFFFTYFYTAIQYNVEDISNNLKRGGSLIPGVRPGKQTKDFLDDIISKVTIVGAGFLSIVALMQYLTPSIVRLQQGSYSLVGGTSLLIMVSVALETVRQLEANLLMKHYNN